MGDAPACPGCHFGCAIDDYQCARGEALYGTWEAGRDLPARRNPGSAKPPADTPKPSQNGRLMHLLHIVGIALRDLQRESGADDPARQAIDCLLRHGKAASARIVEGRTHLPAEELGKLLDELEERGLVTTRPVRDATTLYQLTDEGLAQARAGQSRREAAEAEFLSVLDDGEKQQLADLILKILEPGFRKR